MKSETSVIEQVSGRALPVRGHDIDTDRIIPARFLKAVTFEGLGDHAFEDDRKQLREAGAVHPFDNPAYSGASILLANANFGCGSSREHAPQALRRWGIRGIVAESFAEIFFGNSGMIGLPCATATHEEIEMLMSAVEKNPALQLTLDVRAGRIAGDGLSIPVTLPASSRDSFLTGHWDGTGLLLADYDAVERTAAKLPYLAGF